VATEIVISVFLMVIKMSKENKNFIDEEKLYLVGFNSSKKKRSGSFLIIDKKITKIENWSKKLEILPLSKATAKYSWLENYLKSISQKSLGYFIRVLPNTKINYPIQACFYMRENKSQTTHNIFVAEPNSKVNLISGCTASVEGGRHLGISHYYVRENALLSVTKIHHWPPHTSSISRNSIVVEKNATFISNYVALTLGKKEESRSTINIKEGGIARINSIIYAEKDSNFRMSDRILLDEENARAEILSKTISNGGKTLVKEYISGRDRGTRGHIECDGLLLNNEGVIHTIPELEAIHPQTDLSHEAAVGRISEEELNYLMSKGIDEETAKSLIIRGFLEVKIKGLSRGLQESIERLIKKISIEGTT